MVSLDADSETVRLRGLIGWSDSGWISSGEAGVDGVCKLVSAGEGERLDEDDDDGDDEQVEWEGDGASEPLWDFCLGWFFGGAFLALSFLPVWVIWMIWSEGEENFKLA